MVDNTTYLAGRKKYARPQAIIFADSYNTETLLPDNYEIGSDNISGTNDFIILSDHNRSQLDVSSQRIEQRERMINGRMRSYHIADKVQLSVSWDMLPSRAFSEEPNFDPSSGALDNPLNIVHTADGGAGGSDLLRWYETHNGPFYVLLAYDKNTDFIDNNQYGRLDKYNEAFEMYFSDFSYNVIKRGGSTFDFWNISMTLEEV